MPHWKSMMETDYLFAFDLEGKDRVVTIVKVESGKIKGTGGKSNKKPLATFREFPKPLALNATNCKTIAAMFGAETEGWSGKKITLYPTQTQFGGETVDCIRVRGGNGGAHSPHGDRDDYAEPEDNECYEALAGMIALVRNGLDTCASYQQCLALRGQLGSKAKPAESALTRDLQRAREENLVGFDGLKELSKRWNHCDRQLAKLEAQYPAPSVEASFVDEPDDATGDPAEDFAR